MKKFSIGFIAGMLLLASTAHAQDAAAYMMQQQTVQNALMQASIDSNNEARKKPPVEPQKPATLYRERVPGKPEEGFVPVAAAPTARIKYVQTKVSLYGKEIRMLDDLEKGVKCYLTPENYGQPISCVKY